MTLKEAKPSKEAIDAARDAWFEGAQANYNKYLAVVYPIDVAPLIAERDALTNEVQRLRAGLSAIVHCQSGLTRSEVREACAEILDGKTTQMQNQSPFIAALVAAKARVAELEKERDEVIIERDLARESRDQAISALAASRQQVEWLKNISALDAPVPEARDDIAVNTTYVSSVDELRDTLSEKPVVHIVANPRDAIIAEVVVLRPFAFLNHPSDIFHDGGNRRMTETLKEIHPNEEALKIARHWRPPNAMKLAPLATEAIDKFLRENPLPEELARPVTNDEVERALIIASGHDPSKLRDRQTYTINFPTKDTIRAALTDFLALRAKEPKR